MISQALACSSGAVRLLRTGAGVFWRTRARVARGLSALLSARRHGGDHSARTKLTVKLTSRQRHSRLFLRRQQACVAVQTYAMQKCICAAARGRKPLSLLGLSQHEGSLTLDGYCLPTLLCLLCFLRAIYGNAGRQESTNARARESASCSRALY